MKNVKALVLSLMLFSTLSPAQTGGSYTITKSVTAGGGSASSGGNYSMTATIGQSIAGNASTGGNYNLLPGFWSPETQNRTPFDFDGDRKTDIGIFRASDGSWWYSRSSDNQVRVFSFGISTDILTPGDFTGDGKTDIAVFRPSTGFWFVQRSEDNSFFSFPFGTSGDIAAPADFDGDGRTDAAVFRPGSGKWFILNSGGSGTSIHRGKSHCHFDHRWH